MALSQAPAGRRRAAPRPSLRPLYLGGQQRRRLILATAAFGALFPQGGQLLARPNSAAGDAAAPLSLGDQL